MGRTTQAQTDYRRASDDATSSTRSHTSALDAHADETDRATTSLDRFNRIHRQYQRVVRDSEVETRRSGTAMRSAGDDGDFLERQLGGVSAAFVKARISGRNFASVLNLIKFPAIIAGLQSLISLISALSAGLLALIPRLAQVSGLLAGLPGLFVALGQAVGVSILGFKGIGDAVKALADRQAAAADIQQQQTDALARVADAEEAVAASQAAAQDAQEALTQAREDARDALQDLRLEAERARLGEEGAEISLIEARRNLREMQRDTGEGAPTDLDLRAAALAVESAELDLKDARTDNQRTTEELREAERKGVEQSEQVVDARETLAQVTHDLADSQTNLALAVEEATAQESALATEQEKLREAFRALTPEARAFARQIFSMRDLLDELRQTAQRGILPGAGAALEQLTVLFPAVREAVGNTAQLLGRIFENLARGITTADWQRDLPLIFEQSDRVIERAGRSLGYFLDIMRNIVIEARPLVDWISRTVEGWLATADAAAEAGRESGRMREFFLNAVEAAEQLGRIIGDTFIALKNVFEQGAAVGEGFWDSIEEGAETFREWTESVRGENAIRSWFERAEPVVREFMRLVGAIGRAFFDIAAQADQGLVPLLRQLRTDLVPALVELGASVSQGLMPAIVELLTNITRLFVVMGGQSGGLTAFISVLNEFAEIVLFLLDTVPGLREALSFAFIVTGLASAFSFLGTILKGIFWNRIARQVFSLFQLFQAGGIKGALSALATKFPTVAAALTSTGAAATAAALALPLLAAAAGYTLNRLLGFAAENERAARIIHTKLVPAIQEAETALDRSAPKFQQQIDGFVEMADFGGQAVVTNEDFAKVLEDEVIPAQAEGSLSQETWNKFVDEGNDRGYDAVEMLHAYEVAQEKAAQAAQRAGTRIILTTSALDRNQRAASVIAEQMGLSFGEFREQAAEAAEQGGDALTDFIDRSLEAIRQWRQEIRESFDGVSDVLSEFQGDTEISADEIERSFDDQIDVLNDYQDNWETVSKRLGPNADQIREDILEMGLDGAEFVEGLASANDEQFNRIIDKWRTTRNESGDLAGTVEDELAPAIDRLADVLKRLPERIEIALGLDTTRARQSMDRFLEGLENKGIVVKGAQGGRLLADPLQQRHSGGPAGAGSYSFGPPRSDEVDTRLQKGEYVLSREAVRGAGGMSAVDRMHERFKRRRKFHRGGGIGFHTHENEGENVDDLAARISDVRNFSLTMVLPRQRFASMVPGLPTGPLAGGAPVGLTPNASYAARILRTLFPEGLSMGGKSIRNIMGTSTFSQHSYGNALDIFSPLKQTIADFLHANAAALKVAELIYNHRDSWRGGPWGPYTGTSNPHTDHVHVDFWPWWTGDPYTNGHPAGYAKGGRVRQRRAVVHRDEFVLQRRAASALGDAGLTYLNSAADRLGPAAFLEAFNQSFATPAIPRMGGIGDGLGGGDRQAMFSIAMHLDGKTISRSVDVYSREADILLPGR